MALTQDIYSELEQIVGSKNVSNDPVITVNYAYSFGSDVLCEKLGLEKSYFAYECLQEKFCVLQ